MINEINKNNDKQIFKGCFFLEDIIYFRFIGKEKEKNDNKNENNNIFKSGWYMKHGNQLKKGE